MFHLRLSATLNPLNLFSRYLQATGDQNGLLGPESKKLCLCFIWGYRLSCIHKTCFQGSYGTVGPRMALKAKIKKIICVFLLRLSTIESKKLYFEAPRLLVAKNDLSKLNSTRKREFVSYFLYYWHPEKCMCLKIVSEP